MKSIVNLLTHALIQMKSSSSARTSQSDRGAAIKISLSHIAFVACLSVSIGSSFSHVFFKTPMGDPFHFFTIYLLVAAVEMRKLGYPTGAQQAIGNLEESVDDGR